MTGDMGCKCYKPGQEGSEERRGQCKDLSLIRKGYSNDRVALFAEPERRVMDRRNETYDKGAI